MAAFEEFQNLQIRSFKYLANKPLIVFARKWTDIVSSYECSKHLTDEGLGSV